MSEIKSHEYKKITKAFKSDAVKVRLTGSEKDKIQKNIFVSPYSVITHHAWSQRKVIAYLVLIAFIITGGGTSYAAESALPGDVLYGVKINVNEEIRSFVAVSPDAKAHVEIDRANERLNEAVELSKTGKLNKDNEEVITTNLKKHTDSIKASVAVLTSENKISEAKSIIKGLKIAMDDHENSLKTIASSTASTTDIIMSVAEVKADIKIIQKDIDTNASTSVATSTTGTVIHNATTTSATSTEPITPVSTSTESVIIDNKETASSSPKI